MDRLVGQGRICIASSHARAVPWYRGSNGTVHAANWQKFFALTEVHKRAQILLRRVRRRKDF